MTVKELLDKTDRTYISGEMTQRYGGDLEEGEAYTAEAVEHMLALKPERSGENLIVCAQYREWFPDVESPTYMDTTLYKKAELLSENGMSHGYAYDMIPWPRILGTDVAQTSIELYGTQECALAIYHEMTFFGCWKEQWESNVRELLDCQAQEQAYPVADLWEGIDVRQPEPSCSEEEQGAMILRDNRAVLAGILKKEQERLQQPMAESR